MRDKILGHANSVGKKVCKSQGGASFNAGPNSANAPKASGDAVTNPTQYTQQDQSREQGGPPKNKFHDV